MKSKFEKTLYGIYVMYVTRGTNFVTHKLCSNDTTHFANKIFQHSTASNILAGVWAGVGVARQVWGVW